MFANITHSTKFRWTLESKNLAAEFVKSLSFDYVKKTINIVYYDVITENGGLHAIVWADNLDATEVLTFKCFDGMGREQYEFEFSGLRLVEHTADFDYASSDIATTNLVVKYERISKKLSNKENAFKNKQSKLIFNDKEFEIFTSENRPQITIEEQEINYLGEKTWIPGKAVFHSIKFIGEHGLMQKLSNATTLLLRNFENNKAVDEWKLENVKINLVGVDNNNSEYSLEYKGLNYKSFPVISF